MSNVNSRIWLSYRIGLEDVGDGGGVLLKVTESRMLGKDRDSKPSCSKEDPVQPPQKPGDLI